MLNFEAGNRTVNRRMQHASVQVIAFGFRVNHIKQWLR
jgi:hypothetical protein